MKRLALRWRGPLPRVGLFPVLAGVLLYLVFRNTGLYPAIFADEWYYSSFSRLMPLREVSVPSYLYFSVFRLTNHCGPGFLECARLLNALFLVAAAPFIYLLARRVVSVRLAAAIGVLSILAPVNTYTAFFMPEAMYFFAFWAWSWTVLRFYDRPTRMAAAQCAAVLGLMTMVKIHALFLWPAFCLFLVWTLYVRRASAGGRAWLREAAIILALTLLGAALVRLTAGYLFAGTGGLDLLGNLYGSQAAHSQATHASLWSLLPVALVNLKGHLMACALLFGMPLAAALLLASSRALRAPAGSAQAMLLYGAVLLATLLAVSVVFTASVAGKGPYETASRLHMRYYDFLFPFFLICAGWQSTLALPATTRRRRALIALPLAAFIVYAKLRLGAEFTPNFVDSPELRAMAGQPRLFAALTVLALLALAAWVRDARQGARCFLFLFTPALTLAGGALLNHDLRHALQADAHIQAGQFAHQYLTAAERARLTIAGSDPGGLFKTRFFVDNQNAAILDLAAGAPVPLAALAPDKDWLLVIGEHAVPGKVVRHLPGRDFSLLQIVPATEQRHVFDFSNAQYDAYLMRSAGLAAQESWGRWSNAGQVRFDFAWPLPKAFTLVIDAYAFGPNVGRDFVVRVGSEQQTLRLGDKSQRQSLRFRSDGTQSALQIDIPQPASPKSLGQSADERLLGMALLRLELIPDPAPAATAP